MRAAPTVLMMLAAMTVAAAQAPMEVGTLRFAELQKVADVDGDRLKGQPSRLAWSPDGSQLYLQMMDGAFGQPGAKLSHYVFGLAHGRMQNVQGEPDWASAYWTEKSGQASPDGPSFKIELKSEVRTEKTTSAPMGGDLARGGTGGTTGSGSGDAMAAAYNQQAVPVHTMRLAGETVGEFVNSVIVPGMTFGWGPRGTRVIAFSAVKSGRVVVMDEKGTKQEVGGSRDAILPAWSPDWTRLVWLQKGAKRKYELKMVQRK